MGHPIIYKIVDPSLLKYSVSLKVHCMSAEKKKPYRQYLSEPYHTAFQKTHPYQPTRSYDLQHRFPNERLLKQSFDKYRNHTHSLRQRICPISRVSDAQSCDPLESWSSLICLSSGQPFNPAHSRYTMRVLKTSDTTPMPD